MEVALNADFGNKVGEAGKAIFPHTISGNFNSKQSYASNYTFVGRDECIQVDWSSSLSDHMYRISLDSNMRYKY